MRSRKQPTKEVRTPKPVPEVCEFRVAEKDAAFAALLNEELCRVLYGCGLPPDLLTPLPLKKGADKGARDG